MINAKGAFLIVSSEFPPLPGGIGNHAYCLARFLLQRGYSVKVLTDARANSQQQLDQFIQANSDIEITFVLRSKLGILTYLNRLWKYRKLTREESLNIIFSGKFSIWLAALGWHKKNAWAVLHGSEIKQSGLKKQLFLRGLMKTDVIVSVSSFTQNYLLTHFPELRNKNIRVINNGFFFRHNPNSEPKCIKGKGFQLITVGGMHPRKGQQNVIRALPKIVEKFPDVTYTIAGLPNNLPELKRLAEEYHVSNYVRFVISPSDEELSELLRSSHVFLMLSENLPNGDFEGFGIAILEGMSMGLPAIGSANSGISDAILHHQSGILIQDIHDTNEIVLALSAIRSNYSEYSSRALNWSNRFRWDRIIDQYISLIEA